ncbi:MAG TPA: hypothetical protein VMX35_16900 [Acidobacteriota bacterium]|nr:hypothetical protein [Acidobacteriota bacterium]
MVLVTAILCMVLPAAIYADDTNDSYWNKNQISEIIVREFGGNYWVVVLLSTPVNGFDGFYYYEFANLMEAVTFGDLFRRGRIRGVNHYTSGKTGYWGTNKIAVIARFYVK